jgi:hypothetical protein
MNLLIILAVLAVVLGLVVTLTKNTKPMSKETISKLSRYTIILVGIMLLARMIEFYMN